MKIHIDGSPDDLIKRCDTCKYCIFEDILTDDQRRIKVLNTKIPKNHVHRDIIEQICGRQYDEVCPMKYAAQRAFVDDRTAMQMGVVKNYVWDLGKIRKKKVAYTEAMKNWTKDQDLGRGSLESYAKRFDEIWDMGIREIKEDDNIIKKQILTADVIYGMVMAKKYVYENIISSLKSLIEEHVERDSI